MLKLPGKPVRQPDPRETGETLFLGSPCSPKVERILSHGLADVAGAEAQAEALRRVVADEVLEAVLRKGLSTEVLRPEVANLAAQASLDVGAFSFAVFARAAAAPELWRLPPRIGVTTLLALIDVFAGIESAALWIREADETFTCAGAVGPSAASGAARQVARDALAGPREAVGLEPAFHVTVVRRFGRPAAALVVKPGDGGSEAVRGFVFDSLPLLEHLLERDLMLERNAERERAIGASLERRLTRTAFDLHDGPLQELSALGTDLAGARERIVAALESDDRRGADGRFEDLQARLGELDRSLRGLLRSMLGGGAGVESLGARIEHEVQALRDAADMEADLIVAGSVADLSESQRIAIFRIVQEALTNVYEHSGARRAVVRIASVDERVEVSIEDDGCGFDLESALAEAAEHSRFGLVGMRERVRLLGGDLRIDSALEQGTRISFALEAWHPLTTPQASPGPVTREVLV